MQAILILIIFLVLVFIAALPVVLKITAIRYFWNRGSKRRRK